MRCKILAFVSLLIVQLVQSCHHYQDLDGYEVDYSHYRKKRSTEEEAEQKATLVNFFTECMTNKSNIGLDWYSATDWAIEDSNWYYYTDSSDCAGEIEANETSCWMNRVGLFINDQLSPTVKSCIESYAQATGFVDEEEDSDEHDRRKKRQISNKKQPPPPKPHDSKPPRNSQCPQIPDSYRRELQKMVPPGFRPPKPPKHHRNRRNVERAFNITSVVDFVDQYTICNECERYTGESAIQCFTDRFDRLTRYDSTLKTAIQRVNAKHAGGSDIVGDCYENVYWTEWFNVDNPNYGVGDDESLAIIRRLYPGSVCDRPRGIQAQISGSEQPYGRGNNYISQLSPETGLVCRNSDQTNGRCQNYRVRFCCRDFVGSCPLGSSWSPYFDRPVQRPFGEVEPKPRGRVCMNPTGVAARVVSSDISHFEARQNVLLRPNLGLVCFNQKQANNQCENYKVRFCCPSVVGTCQQGHRWTKWFKTPLTITGDNERLENIRNRPDYPCTSEPSAVQAEIARTRRPYVEGGNFLMISPQIGLLCLNFAQPNHPCKNYNVRFCCQQPPRQKNRGDKKEPTPLPQDKTSPPPNKEKPHPSDNNNPNPPPNNNRNPPRSNQNSRSSNENPSFNVIENPSSNNQSPVSSAIQGSQSGNNVNPPSNNQNPPSNIQNPRPTNNANRPPFRPSERNPNRSTSRPNKPARPRPPKPN